MAGETDGGGVGAGSERGVAFPEVEMHDLGFGAYPSETPSTRLPVYTRGNAGEVWPEVVYPLTISMARSVPDAFEQMAMATGLVSEDDVDARTCFSGVFGGYIFLNLSFTRLVGVRTIGTTIEENDATFMNSESAAPEYVAHPDDKNWKASLRGMAYALRSMRRTDLPQLAAHRNVAAMWEARLPTLLEADDAVILAAIHEAQGPTMEMFAHHLEVSAMAGAALQQLIKFCESQLGDADRALPLLAGLGDVDSAAPSMDLWKLGRIAATNSAVGAHFDAGLDGLADRLAADDACGDFSVAFARFQRDFGSRGPNEWETASETWGTDPALPLALIDRMRGGDDSHDPIQRAKELASDREAAVAAARSETKAPLRGIFDRLLAATEMYSRGRERAKTIVVAQIHVIRLLSRELAGRTAARVPGGQMKDMWFVLGTELDDYLARPEDFVETIAARRATREQMSRRIPPFVFSGEVPDPATWAVREDAPVGDAHEAGTVLSGLSACPGVIEGRACIVLDPADPGDLGPGDILIAPLTDPAWTPLFVPVEGVVVDVGGQMSHAMIVSRELGLPCVVGVASATTSIPHGARIRVDGDAGTVTVLP